MNKSAFRLSLVSCLAAAFLGCDSGKASSSDGDGTADQGPWKKIPAKSDAVRTTGRFAWNPEGYAFASWSGSAITVGFNGTALKAFISSGSAVYDIFIDGEEFPSDTLDITEATTQEEYIIADQLTPGPHSVRIQKNTESFFSSVLFMGFEVMGEAAPEALPPLPEKRIEFIGNSITCGYGVLDTADIDTFNIKTQDHFYSFAGQAARILGAEEHSVCVSGKGVLRNFDNSTDGTLPEVYKYTNYDKAGAWDPSDWIPHIVFVNLGTNDFNKGTPDSAAFTNAVFDFAKELRSDYPEASIVLLSGPMLDSESLETCRRFLDGAAGMFKDSLDKNIYRFDFEQQGELGTGGNGHPNRAQALKDGESLASWVKETFNW